MTECKHVAASLSEFERETNVLRCEGTQIKLEICELCQKKKYSLIPLFCTNVSIIYRNLCNYNLRYSIATIFHDQLNCTDHIGFKYVSVFAVVSLPKKIYTSIDIDPHLNNTSFLIMASLKSLKSSSTLQQEGDGH